MVKLATVERALSGPDATWIAGRTSRGDMSLAEFRRRSLGAQSDTEINRLSRESYSVVSELQSRLEVFGNTASLPERFSWLDPIDNLGREIITPPKDQSPDGFDCNSCVAFAVVGAIEAQMNKLAGQIIGEVNLSEGYLFFGRCGECCQNGWNTVSALNQCLSGLPSEDAFPYYPRPSNPPSTIQPVVYLDRWRNTRNAADAKRAVIHKGPTVAEMVIFEDFKHYREGVYRHEKGREVGQHVIVIVGYDDNPSTKTPPSNEPPYWLCKNSWGTDWGFDPRISRATPDQPGTGGFFKIAYDECDIGALPMFELTLHVELSYSQAKGTLDQIIAAAKELPPLMDCLAGYYNIGIGTSNCDHDGEEVIEVAENVLRAYPDLNGYFTNQIG